MKGIYRKTTAIVILLLFVIASITPVTGGLLFRRSLFKQSLKTSSGDDFDDKIETLMYEANLPSLAACIIKEDSVVWSNGYGKYNYKTDQNASDDTIYMIGSISKTITAMAIMQLYEDGYFELDDNVSEDLDFELFNPNFNKTNITYRMLLSHQSSLFEFTIFDPADEDEKVVNFLIALRIILNSFPLSYNPGPWLKMFLDPNEDIYETKFWMDYAPGEKANYSNLNFVILSYLVKRLTGQTIEEYCQENIFEPLNMKNTSFHPYFMNMNKMATPFIYLGGFYLPLPNYDFFFASGAGGIRTTIEDLSHFLIAHMNNGTFNGKSVLEKDTVDEMHRLQYPGSYFRQMQFGLGWQVWFNKSGVRHEGHKGSGPGLFASMLLDKENNTGIIFFTNNRPKTQDELDAITEIEETLFNKAKEY